MSKAERLQWWVDHLGVALATRRRHDIACSPMGVSHLLTEMAKSDLRICPDDDDHTQTVPTCRPTMIQHPRLTAQVSLMTNGHGIDGDHLLMSWARPAGITQIPALLLPHRDLLHRCHWTYLIVLLLIGKKIGTVICLDNLCVSRPVGEADIERTPAAKGGHAEGVGQIEIQIRLG